MKATEILGFMEQGLYRSHPPILHGVLFWGRGLGILLLILGLLTVILGITWRFRLITALAIFAIAVGFLSILFPDRLFLEWLGFTALVAVIAYGIGAAISSHRYLKTPVNQSEIERLRLLYGKNQISCFTGDGIKKSLQAAEGLISYQVCWGVAVAVGDPLTSFGHNKEAVKAFLGLCDTRHWIPCFFQADATLSETYKGLGFHLFKFGEEALVDVKCFDIGSPQRADVRHEVARARRANLKETVLRGSDLDQDIWSEMGEVSKDWLGQRGGWERGFSLGRFELHPNSSIIYTIARDQNGKLQAFCSWIRMGENGLALDLIRRRRNSGPGAVDLCIVTAIDKARAEGLLVVSLGSVPFKDSRKDAVDGYIAHKIREKLYRWGYKGYRYEGLSHFKSRFTTRWESRDIVLSGGFGSVVALLAVVRLHRVIKKNPE